MRAIGCAIDHRSRVAGLMRAGTMPWFGALPDSTRFHREPIAPLENRVPAHVRCAAFAGCAGDDFSQRLRAIEVPTSIS